jgi:hypothetical protein
VEWGGRQLGQVSRTVGRPSSPPVEIVPLIDLRLRKIVLIPEHLIVMAMIFGHRR